MLAVISRYILGLVFLFSGFTKGADPIGFAYSISEYMHAFQLSSLTDLSIIVAVAVIILELMTGFTLLTGFKPKVSFLVAFIFMFIFTGLTFVLAVTDKIEDCGCFGSTLVLTNWQTFAKNAVLMLPATYLFMIRNNTTKSNHKVMSGVVFTLFVLFASWFVAYCYRTQPLLDLPNYSVGALIEPIIRQTPNTVALIQVVPNVTKVSPETQKEFNELFMFCNERGHEFYAYTSSGEAERIEYMRNSKMPFQFEIADEMALKNLMRSKAGLVAVSNGIIIGKWSVNNMPTIEQFTEHGIVATALKKQNHTIQVMAIIIATLLLIVGLIINRQAKY